MSKAKIVDTYDYHEFWEALKIEELCVEEYEYLYEAIVHKSKQQPCFKLYTWGQSDASYVKYENKYKLKFHNDAERKLFIPWIEKHELRMGYMDFILKMRLEEDIDHDDIGR